MSISKDALEELKERSHSLQVFHQRLHCLYFCSYSLYICIPSELFITFLFCILILSYDAKISISNRKGGKKKFTVPIRKAEDFRKEFCFSPCTVPPTVGNQWWKKILNGLKRYMLYLKYECSDIIATSRSGPDKRALIMVYLFFDSWHIV